MKITMSIDLCIRYRSSSEVLISILDHEKISCFILQSLPSLYLKPLFKSKD